MAEATEVQVEQPQPPTAPADDVILHAKNITKVFPGTVALDSVDFCGPSAHKIQKAVLLEEKNKIQGELVIRT